MRARSAGRRSRTAATALAAGLALALAGCAHHPAGDHASRPPAADSITIGLWHFDESGGTACRDSGRFAMNGVAGLDTRTDFGRFGNGRIFGISNESWVFVPFSDVMNTGHLTVEAWIAPDGYGNAEDTPIACRWTENTNEQSWLFSLVGLQRQLTLVSSPGYHERFVNPDAAMHLMFTFQPSQPGVPQTYFSNREIPAQGWTHVAVTHDGSVVRFWINGLLDSQFATRATIRVTGAPLLVGNYFDTRVLTDFAGNLNTGGRISGAPVYAFRGMIDELRISSEARSSFGVAP